MGILGIERRWSALALIVTAQFMVILDVAIVNVALPSIKSDLGFSQTNLQWVISAYTLIFASLQITAGGLGDRFGRKRWFMIGLVIFTSVSAVAAFSPNGSRAWGRR